ncbi:MAG: hypothetical protein V2J02_16370 [Pseudomonadales bacterium]|jgi:hypothetical protein|nr:hypothetical protein [Pseudomonadales bacterium]
MRSMLRVLLASVSAGASALAVAHPGHGAPPTHLHGELIFLGLFGGVLVLCVLLRLTDHRRGREGSGRARP